MQEQSGKTRRIALRIAFTLVPAIFVAALAVGVLRSQKVTVVGQSAPDFTIAQLALGAPPLDSDDLRGKVVVVNFFSSWCIPCRDEAPILERAWQSYRSQGLVVLGVNIQDAEEDARAFIEKYGISYPVVRDTNQELANQFGVKGIPETFFIDHRWSFAAIGTSQKIGSRGKTVVYGAISSALLRDQIESLIAEARKSQ